MSSRRFTTQCLCASTEKGCTTGGPAAVRDFNPAYDRFGSKAEKLDLSIRCPFGPRKRTSDLRLMSMPPGREEKPAELIVVGGTP